MGLKAAKASGGRAPICVGLSAPMASGFICPMRSGVKLAIWFGVKLPTSPGLNPDGLLLGSGAAPPAGGW